MFISALNSIKQDFGFKKNTDKFPVTRPVDLHSNNAQISFGGLKMSAPLSCDVVSFSGKNYGQESILHPTEHCAYCGSKVYDEQQLDSIAKEILSSKSDRLEGKVKSVLEKLSDAIFAPELALAKEIENKDHIEFFKGIQNASAQKPYAKGEDLVRELHGVENEEALKLVTGHLHPLLSTIDHVSPQRLDQENNNVDANLVEACYCCNHDIKRGINFREFFTMFPSIEHNMPKEKFIFAKSELLEQEASGVEERLSAATLIKHADFLFAQKVEAQNALKSVNHRISECAKGIKSSISAYKDDIKEKEDEIETLETRLNERKQDPEFNAMLRRNELQSNIRTVNGVITSFNEQRQRISNAINDIKFDKKAKKKHPEPKKLTPEEQKKVDDYKVQLDYIALQTSEQEEKRTEYELEIEEINEKFPPIEYYQQKKNEADAVYNAHISLENETATLQGAQNAMNALNEEEKGLKRQEADSPVKEFSVSSYDEEQQAQFSEYKGILEALDFIDKHQNGGGVKSRINTKAKVILEQDLEEIKKEPIVSDYLKYEEYLELQRELKRTAERKIEVQKQISTSSKLINRYKNASSPMSKEEAKAKSEEYSDTIYRLNEKKNDLEIPQRIESLLASIGLINSTIETLQAKLIEIQTSYSK